MNHFAENIRPFVDLELRAAEQDSAREFAHLERAHVLGQASTREHVRVHWRMLKWAWRHRDAREFAGQTFRIVGVDEADASKGWISFRSPMAQAILGARPGDIVEAAEPLGDIEVKSASN